MQPPKITEFVKQSIDILLKIWQSIGNSEIPRYIFVHYGNTLNDTDPDLRENF